MKTKQLLFTIALLFSVAFVNAQDKYEFITILYKTDYRRITISIDGNELIREDLDLPKTERGADNVNPLFKKVKEYQDKGWEVMSFNVISSNIGSTQSQAESYYAFLKKKKA